MVLGGDCMHVIISVVFAVTALAKAAAAAAGASSSSLSWLAMSSSSGTRSSSGGSHSFMYRKSTLLPWSSTTTTGHGGGGERGDGGPGKNIISLGTCIERRQRRRHVVLPPSKDDSEDDDGGGNDTENDNDGSRAVLRCTVQIHNNGNNENDSDDTNGNNSNETTLLDVDLPEGRSEGSDGGLASQLWPSALASAILLASPEFCAYLNDDHNKDKKGDNNDDEDLTLSEEDSQKLKNARRKERREKMVVELGSGRGLAGLVASKIGADCILTDNDEDAVQLLKDAAVMLNNDKDDSFLLQAEGKKTTPIVEYMDWRDNEKAIDDDRFPIPVDMVFGSDIAYYWYLLRPIMDTTMRLFGKRIREEEIGGDDDGSDEETRENRRYSHVGRGGGELFVVVGQANRESQWDLYKNIRDGCYNQLTDKNEPPWEGSTNMILYNLRMSEFCESLEDCDKCIDGTVPIAVLVHQNPCDGDGGGDGDNNFEKSTVRPSSPFLPFGSAYAHIATDEDDENILKSF